MSDSDSTTAASGPSGQRIVIVGGVAGGASAAARARRLSESARITIIERGEHVSFANCGLPYHIGGTIKDRGKLLVQTPEGLRRRFAIEVRTRTEALRIDRDRKELAVRDLANGAESAIPYDTLVLSPGADPIRPAIPGVDSRGVLTLRSMADMDRIKAAVDSASHRQAVVVGAGYIGLEMAEALRERGMGVTLVELADQVMAPIDREMATPLHHELALNGVDLRLASTVRSIEERGDGLMVQLSTGESIACSLVLLAIGVRPDVKLAREAGLAIGPRGGIVVDRSMRTSDPAVLAVGDAVEVVDPITQTAGLVPLAGPANRQGRIAADTILGRTSTYRGTQGTAICKVFGLAVGMTGISEKTARRLGIAFEKVYVHAPDHASYYPGARQIHLKLLFAPDSGKLLGAQAVGAAGVDKRIDVLAVAIRAGMTVHDLEELELSYAPPFGSAKDPVNVAGFVAGNVLRGDVRIAHVGDLDPPDGAVLLDVRTAGEFSGGTIPGAVNLPLDELRGRLSGLDREKEYLVFCQIGLRGYLACRILGQAGFRCRNLSGGYTTYGMFMSVPERCSTPPGKDRAGPAGPSPEKDAPSAAGAPAPRACAANVVRQVDASGLQCPGPVLRLKTELDAIKPGEAITIVSSDVAFASDVPAWCRVTGHELVEVAADHGRYRATVVKREAPPGALDRARAPGPAGKTLVVFSGDFDRAMASFIIANGAASMGAPVTMFFTFWGLNVLRRSAPVEVEKTLVERLFGWMMPRGADRLPLSKMNMGGMGLAMIKGIMRDKRVSSLPELIESARKAGVRLVACSMSMDLMGIKREELIDGVELGGVAMYLGAAEESAVNLFV